MYVVKLQTIPSLDSLSKFLKKHANVLVFVTGKYCPSCQKQQRTIRQSLSEIRIDYPDLSLICIDGNVFQQWLLEQFNLQCIPALLCYKDEQCIYKIVGYQSITEIELLLENYY